MHTAFVLQGHRSVFSRVPGIRAVAQGGSPNDQSSPSNAVCTHQPQPPYNTRTWRHLSWLLLTARTCDSIPFPLRAPPDHGKIARVLPNKVFASGPRSPAGLGSCSQAWLRELVLRNLEHDVHATPCTWPWFAHQTLVYCTLDKHWGTAQEGGCTVRRGSRPPRVAAS